MALIPNDPSAPWPPLSYAPVAKTVERAGIWYRGQETELDGYYESRVPQRKRNMISSFFNSDGAESVNLNTSTTRNATIHMPIASDIASVAADLLFGEPVQFIIPEAHMKNDLRETALETEAYIGTLADEDGWDSALLESAELSSGYGGVYLVPKWYAGLEHPILSVVMPGNAVPLFRDRRLIEVVFWSTIRQDGGKVYRHLEQHIPGEIRHYLFIGTPLTLGVMGDLRSEEATKGLWDDGAGSAFVTIDLKPLGITGLACRLVPNVLPNRPHPDTGMGRSDTAGVEDAMNKLDETWESWMNDLKLSRSRIIVPQQFMENAGRGKGSSFDFDREVFVPLDMEEAQDASSITVAQFELRVEQHERTMRALFEQIVQSAGYNTGSFGAADEGGAAMTATEVVDKASRSARTTARKQAYYRRALRDVVHNILLMDVGLCGAKVTPMRAEPTWPGAAETDMRETASTLNLINLAKAASTRTKVAMLHPDWDADMIKAEAELITVENAGPTLGDPFAAPATEAEGGYVDTSAAEADGEVDAGQPFA